MYWGSFRLGLAHTVRGHPTLIFEGQYRLYYNFITKRALPDNDVDG